MWKYFSSSNGGLTGRETKLLLPELEQHCRSYNQCDLRLARGSKGCPPSVTFSSLIPTVRAGLRPPQVRDQVVAKARQYHSGELCILIRLESPTESSATSDFDHCYDLLPIRNAKNEGPCHGSAEEGPGPTSRRILRGVQFPSAANAEGATPCDGGPFKRGEHHGDFRPPCAWLMSFTQDLRPARSQYAILTTPMCHQTDFVLATVLELGMFTGVSALALHEATRQTGAEIVTADVSEKYLKIAEDAFKRHGATDRIRVIRGDCLQV